MAHHSKSPDQLVTAFEKSRHKLGENFDEEIFEKLFEILALGEDEKNQRARIVATITDVVWLERQFPQGRHVFKELERLNDILEQIDTVLDSLSPKAEAALETYGFNDAAVVMALKYIEQPDATEWHIEFDEASHSSDRPTAVELVTFVLDQLVETCRATLGGMPQHHGSRRGLRRDETLHTLLEELALLFWDLVGPRLNEFIEFELIDYGYKPLTSLPDVEQRAVFRKVQQAVNRRRREFVSLALLLGGYELKTSTVRSHFYDKPEITFPFPDFETFVGQYVR